MTHYGGIFLRSLGTSILLFQIPTSLVLVGGRQSPEDQRSSVALTGIVPDNNPYENNSPPPDTEENFQNSPYCPEGTERSVCSLVVGIIEKLESIESNFSNRVHLHLADGGSIPIGEILTSGNSGARDFYLTPRGENGGRGSHLQILNYNLTLHSGGKINKHTKNVMGEIVKHFPGARESDGDFECWRYLAIMKRLAQRGDFVLLKPLELHQYYSIVRDPKSIGLMVEEAKYFYYSGGSIWAGFRGRKYIENFTEALNTYIPHTRA